MENLPALSAKELMSLLLFDGRLEDGRTNHGVAFKKLVDGKVRYVLIPDKPGSIPKGTLHGILSYKQSGIGRKGLGEIIERYRGRR